MRRLNLPYGAEELMAQIRIRFRHFSHDALDVRNSGGIAVERQREGSVPRFILEALQQQAENALVANAQTRENEGNFLPLLFADLAVESEQWFEHRRTQSD